MSTIKSAFERQRELLIAAGVIKPKPGEEVQKLGDAVASVAQPIARTIDRMLGTKVAECGGCKARQEALNRKFPLTPKT